MAEEKEQRKATESQTDDQSLTDDVLEQASGGGGLGDDLLNADDNHDNGGLGNDALSEKLTEAADQPKTEGSSSDDSDYKYVPIRR